MVTLPTVHGESVVTRILDASSAPTDQRRSACWTTIDAKIEEAQPSLWRDPRLTGPTGSGKIHHALRGPRHVNQPRQERSSRSRTRSSTACPASTRCRSTRRRASPSPTACASFLRADPDIIMVGEIRDTETARDRHRSRPHRPLRALDAPHATTRRTRWRGCSTWAIEPFLLKLPPLTASSPSASPGGCARTARHR